MKDHENKLVSIEKGEDLCPSELHIYVLIIFKFTLETLIDFSSFKTSYVGRQTWKGGTPEFIFFN